VTTDLTALRSSHQRSLVSAAFWSYLHRDPTESEFDKFARLVPGDGKDISHLVSAIKETDEFCLKHLMQIRTATGVEPTLTARQNNILRLLRDLMMNAPC
jgi:hypothetical protein